SANPTVLETLQTYCAAQNPVNPNIPQDFQMFSTSGIHPGTGELSQVLSFQQANKPCHSEWAKPTSLVIPNGRSPRGICSLTLTWSSNAQQYGLPLHFAMNQCDEPALIRRRPKRKTKIEKRSYVWRFLA